MPPKHIGPFRLEDQLGAGGMGEVYRAYDQRLLRWVAIKVILAARVDNPSARQRLLREARAAAGLAHPSIVQIFDIVETPEGDCIVMELVHGRPLSKVLDDGPLALPLALSLAVQIAAGLAEAHKHGLVHRDLKAANVMVTADDRTKILDFGLAKRVAGESQAELTDEGAVIGTWHAMSPEQARAQRLDHRSDLFAFGTLLYEMVTGVSPFRGDTMLETLTRVCVRQQPPARELVGTLPPALSDLIDQLLRKDPRDRPQQSSYVLASLRQIAEETVGGMSGEHPTMTLERSRARRLSVRLFLSTVGDVAEERAIAEQMVARLRHQLSGRGRLEVVIWEHEPVLRVDDQTIEPAFEPAEADIVVSILWGRAGSRLTPGALRAGDFASGTAYEIASTQSAYQERGAPQLLVYRKMARPRVLPDDEQELMAQLAQRKQLDELIEDLLRADDKTVWTLAYHRYMTLAELEQQLEQHLRLLIDRALPAGATVTETTTWPVAVRTGSPYRGLEVFDFEHVGIFFGRTRAIADILDALRAQAALGQAFVLVVGMSGGGKSSVVRAGVLPLLCQPGVIEGIGLWRRALMIPSSAAGDLLDALAAALLRSEALPELAADGMDAAALTELMRSSPSTLSVLITAALKRAAQALAKRQSLTAAPHGRLVLVIDQLEEIFTRDTVTAAMRERFFAMLDVLARSGWVWIIATLRSDFYPRCAEIEALVALKARDGQYELLPPTAAEIHQMIMRPARSAGLRMEKDPVTAEPLDEVLRDAAASHPASLPLLQFALEELYKQRTDDGVLTHEAYRHLGGLEGALAQRAEEVFAGLPPAVQEALPEVLRHLVTVGSAGEAGASRRRTLLARFKDNAEAQALVDAFVSARLFVTELADDGSAVVSVAHEALLRHWPRLQSWLEADRELLRSRARVVASAALWDQEGRAVDFLLQDGKPLLEARDLLGRRRDELSATERAFISASIARVRRRRTAMRALLAMLAVLAVVAVIFATVATQQRRLAEQNARVAAARQLAAQALNRFDGQLDLGLLLGLESFQQAAIFEARSSLLAGLATSPRLSRFLHGHGDRVRQVAWHPDGVLAASISDDGVVFVWDVERGRAEASFKASTERAYGLAWSPDGRVLAVSDGNGVGLWDAASQTVIGSLEGGHQGLVSTLAWSPDGRRLASGSRRGTIALWQPATRSALGAPFDGGVGYVRSLAFDPAGRSLAWGGDRGAVRVRELASGAERTFAGHREWVRCVAWSPDGSTLASGGNDRTVRLWDVARGVERQAPLAGHDDNVLTVAWSPDGNTLASAGIDRTVALWQLRPGVAAARQEVLRGHATPVYSVAWSPDGSRLLSSGDDRKLLLWDVSTSRHPGRLVGHEGWVVTAAYSPDGRLLASGSVDERVMLWDAATGQRLATVTMTDGVWKVAWSPDSTVLAVASGRDLMLYRVATGELQGPLADGHDGRIRALAWSPDGATLASAGQDGALRLWDAATASLRGVPLRPGPGLIWSLAFSPDGTSLALGSDQPEVQLWDLSGPPVRRRIGDLARHRAGVWTVAFSPDGRLLASAGADRTVILWDLAASAPVTRPLVGHGRAVQSVAFSPDGAMLASAGDEGSILLWDVTTGSALAQIDDHEGSVWSVTWSPDGGSLASSGFDRSIRVREVGGIASWHHRACRRANRNLTRDEWQRYLGASGVPYRPTCPQVPAAAAQDVPPSSRAATLEVGDGGDV